MNTKFKSHSLAIRTILSPLKDKFELALQLLSFQVLAHFKCIDRFLRLLCDIGVSNIIDANAIFTIIISSSMSFKYFFELFPHVRCDNSRALYACLFIFNNLLICYRKYIWRFPIYVIVRTGS